MHYFPEDLVIPSPYVPSELDYSDCDPITLDLSDRGWTTAWKPSGSMRIDTEKEFFKLLTSKKHHSTICKSSELDGLLKWLSSNQIEELRNFGSIVYGDFTLYRLKSGIRARMGNKHYYIWNLSHFLEKEVTNPTLKTVQDLFDLFIFDNKRLKIGAFGLGSPAGLARTYALTFPEVAREAATVKKLYEQTPEVIKAFYDATFGASQTSSGIGTGEYESWDLEKSHLTLLELCTALSGARVGETEKLVDSDYAVYYIRGEIPQSKFKFPPIPSYIEKTLDFNVKTRQAVLKEGEFEGWYTKPHIELLRAISVPFQIIKGYYIVSRGYPYRRLCSEIRRILKDSTKAFHRKSLYQTLIGSMLYTYPTIDRHTGVIETGSSSLFNPIVASHIFAAQWVYIWWQSHTNDGVVALRCDAITAKKGFQPNSPKFLEEAEYMKIRKVEEGLHTFLNPYLKTFPSGKGKFWRDMIEAYRDKRKIEVCYDTRIDLLRASTPREVASKVEIEREIPPSYGERTGPHVKVLGELTEKWLESKTSSHPPEDQNLGWIEQALGVK